jgi:hypothetical protein
VVVFLDLDNLPLLVGVLIDPTSPSRDLGSVQHLLVRLFVRMYEDCQNLHVLLAAIVEVDVGTSPDILNPFVVMLD